jgi:predicted membrane protein
MEQRKSDKRFYFGVILIVIGVILILEKLNLIPESVSDLIISWPMLLIGIGVLSFIGGNRPAGVVMMLIGGFFLFPDLLEFWPLVLIAIGITLLFHKSHQPVTNAEPVVTTPLEYELIPKDNTHNTFDDFVIFGGREIFINSQNFAGGKATSIFGGMEFDLRKATMVPEGAVIDCVSVFGGCGFKIPMDWNVRNEVTTLFGAFTDKRGETFNERYYDPAKTIVIKGVSIFGGIEVKHF